MILEPGSAEWLKYITASKVPAILGLSPWQSSRSLWDLMTGRAPTMEQTAAQSRGHYLEPAIVKWCYDQHPEWVRYSEPNATYSTLPWAGAAPDSVAVLRADTHRLIPIEAKTDADTDAWGTPNTDEIPTYYAAQGMWSLHMMQDGHHQVERMVFPVLGAYLRFAEYWLEYDPEVAAGIEAQCFEFYLSLTGDVPPPVDGSVATYESLRAVHPDITDDTVEIPASLAREFLTQQHDMKAADAGFKLARNRIAELMGNASTAKCQGQTIAVRASKLGGKPYVQAARKAPHHNDIQAEEAAA